MGMRIEKQSMKWVQESVSFTCLSDHGEMTFTPYCCSTSTDDSPFRVCNCSPGSYSEIPKTASNNQAVQNPLSFNERDLRGAQHLFGIAVMRPGEALKKISP